MEKTDNQFSNHFYDQFDIPREWLHQVDDLLFPLNPNWKRVAVNLSGGADSACGTMILANLIKQNGYDIKIDVITNIRNWKDRPWQGPISRKVFDKIKEQFPGMFGTRHECYIPPELEQAAIGEGLKNKEGETILKGKSCDKIITDSFNVYLGKVVHIDAIYGFVSKNPPLEALADEAIRPRDRDTSNTQNWTYCPQLANRPRNEGYMVRPFLFVEKDWMISQYDKNNWWDLFNMTRSCEGDQMRWPEDKSRFPTVDEYDETTSNIATCEEMAEQTGDWERRCYWCQERSWALKQLAK